MARAGLDRDTVVAAATTLADKHGLAALSLKALAKKLKVQPPSLYNHVDSLAALHRELALDGTKLFAQRLQKAAVGKSADQAVVAVANAYRDAALEHPGLYAASMVVSSVKTAPHDAELRAASTLVYEVVAAVVSGYGLNEEHTGHAVRAMRSALHGFVSLENNGGFGMPMDINSSFATLVQMLCDGLRTMAKTHKSAAP